MTITSKSLQQPCSSQEVVELIKQVVDTGEVVSLTYAYGSRPGLARDLSITSLVDNESAIHVREEGYSEEKTYVVSRIMQVQTQDGTIARNSDAITSFLEYRRARLDYDKERQDLINICAWGSVSKLRDCRFDVSKLAGGYMLWNRKNFKYTTIQARNVESARRAAFAIEMMLTHSHGYWWEIQEVMVSGGIYWPQWMKLQEAANQDGQRIAHQFEAQHAGEIWSQQPLRTRCNAYMQSPLWGKHDWHFMDWGRIFEAGKFDMEAALSSVASAFLGREPYKEYVLNSNGRQKPISPLDCDISEKTLTKLLEKGLAKIYEGPSLEKILMGCKVGQLKLLAQQWGQDVKGLKKADIVQLCLQSAPIDQAKQLVADHATPGLFVLQPPKGLTWEQFQDFKSCYRQMFVSLTAWIDGTLECTEAVAKILD